MEKIIKRAKDLKLKMLDKVENKLNHNLSCQDLLNLSQCINQIEEDKTYYERILTKLSEDRSNAMKSELFVDGYDFDTSNAS